MNPLKPQYTTFTDPLVTVSAKIPESVQRAAQHLSEELNISTSMLVRLALEQYIDGMGHANLILKMELISKNIGDKASDITYQNIHLLPHLEEIKRLLNTLLADNTDIDDKILVELNNMSGIQMEQL